MQYGGSCAKTNGPGPLALVPRVPGPGPKGPKGPKWPPNPLHKGPRGPRGPKGPPKVAIINPPCLGGFSPLKSPYSDPFTNPTSPLTP